jgi:hypothetical protein
MKQLFCIILALFCLLGVSCKKFLAYTPKGVVSDDDLNSPTAVEGLCTAAYAAIGNDDRHIQFTGMWCWASLRGGDAYKGGGGVGDSPWYDEFEKFNLVTPDIVQIDNVWIAIYAGVSRANLALQKLDKLSVADFPNKTIRTAEMRFLRGHLHFLLKEMFKNVPYVSDTVQNAALVTNSTLTNIQLWDAIAADFQYGVDNLPLKQPDIGRATKIAATAYLAKVNLYEAYEQDQTNKVTNINATRLANVVTLCNNVIDSGTNSLSPDFGNNFLYPLSENNSESIFAIQYSINDGTTDGRIDKAHSGTYNMAPPYGCCSFHAPSQNLVNAFKTDPTGIPLVVTWNNSDMKDSIDFWTNGVDPRLDHTIGVPTHPYKYIPNFISQVEWQRVPEVYGQYTGMKNNAQYTCACFKKYGAYFGSSTNITILRYDDVLLWLAEAYIELGQQNLALPLINQIRARASASTAMLKYSDGGAVSNYRCGPYVDGVNCTWTQDYARNALRFERRLEFALEDCHFFDMVRWGIAGDFTNTYFAQEKSKYLNIASAVFVPGRDEYLPIPQNEITLTNGLLKQNPGYY